MIICTNGKLFVLFWNRMHAFMLLSKPWKNLDNSLVIPSSKSRLFCLKMLKLSCQNGSLCKSFFSEMSNSKFIQWICQWQKAFSIKRTHLPLNDQPWFIDYLIRGMSKGKRLLVSIFARRERSELCESVFLLERIFKWHLLSLSIQHKPTKQI